mmetsp:Transcript_22933/g.76979  ORF Transcript_22933/g.76979 Transcript_22933/m.76979 type:complete len:295 (+) Transcript_22933:1493-2377(+)
MARTGRPRAVRRLVDAHALGRGPNILAPVEHGPLAGYNRGEARGGGHARRRGRRRAPPIANLHSPRERLHRGGGPLGHRARRREGIPEGGPRVVAPRVDEPLGVQGETVRVPSGHLLAKHRSLLPASAGARRRWPEHPPRGKLVRGGAVAQGARGRSTPGEHLPLVRDRHGVAESRGGAHNAHVRERAAHACGQDTRLLVAHAQAAPGAHAVGVQAAGGREGEGMELAAAGGAHTEAVTLVVLRLVGRVCSGRRARRGPVRGGHGGSGPELDDHGGLHRAGSSLVARGDAHGEV